MHLEKLNSNTNIKKLLSEIGVDSGGVNILSAKSQMNIIYIKDLHVGAANILKQDALSAGADLAVPRGTVLAKTPTVDCLLIATTRQLQTLAKKELAQPFGLKELAKKLSDIININKPKNVEIMGVINANDDSFFKSSRFSESDALSRIEKMIEDGASSIDIGAVSSAPNSKVVSVEEELSRIEGIYKLIYEHKLYERVKFSADTYEPEVVKRALDSGFKIINDITGLANDEVCRLVAGYDAQAIIMHMQGNPQTMQANPVYDDLLDEVYNFFQERIEKAQSFGVKDIVLDVGIGFGKTLQHNISLIKNLGHFLSLDKPLLVGASRKSMIDKIYPCEIAERLPGTLEIHMESVRNGAEVIRVHDVKEHAQALAVHKALNA
ncbi:dihydropteroate synthase [Sulfurimonas sp.]|uniref:dihydropteroate synthase n=1 Tax=Sulfurimonas sp. TaxID=2022749 RepID=UPI0035683546